MKRSAARSTLTVAPRRAPRPACIALVLDAITGQRLARGMFDRFRPDWTYRFLDIYRPADELFAQLKSWRPDAIVTRWAPTIADQIADLGYPTVLIGGHHAHQPNTICVGVDNLQVGTLAARHLLEREFRHFAYVGKNYPYALLREEGFRLELSRHGFACAHFIEDSAWHHYLEDWPHSDDRLARWLTKLPRPVGLFAPHDMTAWQVVQACQGAGLRVPEDVAVIGANNDELTCGLARPPLSSVSIPWHRIGGEVSATVDRLLAPRTQPFDRTPVRIAPDGVCVRQSSDIVAVPDAAVSQALQFIRARLQEPIGVKEILAHVPLSRRRLEQLFRRYLGRSPKEEIVRMRLERARELLLRSDASIPRIAEACGYTYLSRFSTAFKAATGASPREFRQRYRAAAPGASPQGSRAA